MFLSITVVFGDKVTMIFKQIRKLKGFHTNQDQLNHQKSDALKITIVSRKSDIVFQKCEFRRHTAVLPECLQSLSPPV